jgi:hypothetical protein
LSAIKSHTPTAALWRSISVIVDEIELKLVLCLEHGVIVFWDKNNPISFNDQTGLGLGLDL